MKKILLFALISLMGILTISCDTEGIHNSKKDSIVATGTHQGYEYVDLGLSVKWATCNVGAYSPEQYGDYYAWGETDTKEYYGSDNCISKYYDIDDIKGTNKDVAHVKWGGDWRMPTRSEFNELLNKCDWKLTTYKGVQGYMITGPNGNSIFLPCAGIYYWDTPIDVGESGRYWCSTYEDCLHITSTQRTTDSAWCWYGMSVRPVTHASNKWQQIEDYVSVDAVYEYYAWHITIDTVLQQLYPNAELEYGIRYYYDDGYEYTALFDGKSGLGVAYMEFSDSSIELLYSISLKNGCATEMVYWESYISLENKINSGKELSRDEKDLYNTVKKALEELEDEILSCFSGYVFVRVDGIEYKLYEIK